MRPRFWHRRAQIIVTYGLIAMTSSGLALIAGYVLLLSLAHMMRRGW